MAYLVSRFPKLTETFVIYEILALQAQGVEVEIFPLLRARNSNAHPEGASLWRKVLEIFKKPNAAAVMHAEVRSLIEKAHYHPLVSWAVLRAQWYWLLRRPAEYLGALWTLIRANWGSSNYLAGGLAVFPKVAFLAREMARMGVGHVHAHFANHPAAAAFVVHRLAGIPFSFTAHGADLQVDQHMLREKVREADRVIAISHYNREFIVEKCGEESREKIAVIRCGVDTEVFRPAGVASERSEVRGQRSEVRSQESGVRSPDSGVRDPKPAGSAPPETTHDSTLTTHARTRALTILCIGTMYEVKGHPYLIDACRLLEQRGVPFSCRLVGDGPDRDQLVRRVAQAGLDGRVVFHGLKTRDEIAAMHRQADVLALPSVPTQSGRREGIPVVLMEAMASGLPVVATNISGIPELVEHNETGLLVEPRDPAALADAIERLAGDPELRRRLGRQGRKKILAEFDLRSNAAALARSFAGASSGGEDG